MDLARTRQLLLVALSSGHPNESFNALSAIKTLLSKANKDIHWLANTLGSTTGTALDPQLARLNQELMLVSRQRDAVMAEANRLRREIMLLRTSSTSQASPRGATSAMSPQRQAEQILLKTKHLTLKERDFLVTITRWTGTPTERQLAWLAALWEKYG